MENYTYQFSFGDDQPPQSSSSGSIVHRYTASGSYQASVTVPGSFHFETVVLVQGRYVVMYTSCL